MQSVSELGLYGPVRTPAAVLPDTVVVFSLTEEIADPTPSNDPVVPLPTMFTSFVFTFVHSAPVWPLLLTVDCCMVRVDRASELPAATPTPALPVMVESAMEVF